MPVSTKGLITIGSRKRIREIITVPGRFHPGPGNTLSDVKGVTAGHHTVIEGDNLRTGVTIIKPHPGDIYRQPVPAAIYAGNGHGKLAGGLQIEELGEIESLIGLTNTLSIPQVLQGLLEYHIPLMDPAQISINIVVGETNDGILNDIKALGITPEHVKAAIENLDTTIEEGSVGAGTGTCCYGYKGGIGTASRLVPGAVLGESHTYTIGALVQSNFSGNLNIYGQYLPLKKLPEPDPKGSCMIILATDAPMDARQLKRLAKRGIAGMCETGSYMANGSGDFCIAFSNCQENLMQKSPGRSQRFLRLSDNQLNPLFEAAAEAVREAVYNSLTMSMDMAGYNGRFIEGFELDNFRDTLTGLQWL